MKKNITLLDSLNRTIETYEDFLVPSKGDVIILNGNTHQFFVERRILSTKSDTIILIGIVDSIKK